MGLTVVDGEVNLNSCNLITTGLVSSSNTFTQSEYDKLTTWLGGGMIYNIGSIEAEDADIDVRSIFTNIGGIVSAASLVANLERNTDIGLDLQGVGTQGTSNARGGVIHWGKAASPDDGWLFSNDDNLLVWKGSAQSSQKDAGTANIGFDTGIATFNKLILGTSDIEALLIRSTGDTGDVFTVNSSLGRIFIGIDKSQQSALNINSGLDNRVLYLESTDNRMIVEMKDDDTTMFMIVEDDAISIGSRNRHSTPFNNLYVTTAGDVGIGITTPGSKLEVVGDITSTATIQGDNYKSGDGSLGITQTETSVNTFDITIKDGLITGFTKLS